MVLSTGGNQEGRHSLVRLPLFELTIGNRNEGLIATQLYDHCRNCEDRCLPTHTHGGSPQEDHLRKMRRQNMWERVEGVRIDFCNEHRLSY